MRAQLRRKLDMGDRVRGFNAVHPSPDPAWVGLAQQLDAACTRASELAELQVTKDGETRTGTANASLLRRRLVSGLLRVVIRAGRTAEVEPSVQQKFRLQPRLHPWRAFVAEAGAILKAAREHAGSLAPRGATPELIEKAAARLEQYVTTVREAEAAMTARVEAVAEFKQVIRRVSDLVKRLDAYNRDRFVNDPELLAAWASVRSVGEPSRSNGPAEGEQPAPEAGGGAGPTEGAPPSGAGGDAQTAA